MRTFYHTHLPTLLFVAVVVFIIVAALHSGGGYVFSVGG